MKFLAVLVAISTLLPMSLAQADFRPGRERALSVAEMTIEKATGTLASAKSVKIYMNFTDGVQGPTSFTIMVDGQGATVLKVTSTTPVSGGSVRYTAALQFPNGVVSDSSFTMILIDHSKRVTMDLVSNLWTARIVLGSFGRVRGLIEASGNPKGLMVTM